MDYYLTSTYKKWNKDKIYAFNMRSFTHVFSKEDQQDNWTLYTWLFT
jgi:hypothetical protein